MSALRNLNKLIIGMIVSMIAGKLCLAGIMWDIPTGQIITLAVLFVYAVRVLWITPLLTPNTLPDGTFTAGLEVATYATGYQVAIGLESNRLRWWMELLAYLVPGTNIGIYTYLDGRRVFEFSIHVKNRKTALKLARWTRQESVWDWATRKVLYSK